MTVAGIVLAGGAGSRFEGPTHKLLAEIDGIPVVVRAVRAALDAGFNDLYVVQGAIELSTILPAGITLLTAQDWAEGQSRTLQCGIERARADGHNSVVVGLGDQPMVPSRTWRTVGAARGPIVIASFDGERRPPVKLESEVWDFLPTEGDLGARDLIRGRPDLVSAVACSGNPADIDTMKDLDQWS